MKKLWLAIAVMIAVCTCVVVYRYNMGFRGEQLYMVYVCGAMASIFLTFILVVITGGTILRTSEEK